MGVFALVMVCGLLAGAAIAAAITRTHAFRTRALLAAPNGPESELAAARQRLSTLAAELEASRAESLSKDELLDTQERENDWLRHELEKRPKMARRVYRILTLGISGTGKTALTLKWANPLFDLGLLTGTKIERYERTVSQVANQDIITEHVFEVGDWGGEHIVDALQEAITEEIHGMLLVVDLVSPPPGGATRKEIKGVEMERVARQLREFQPEVLKFFFGPKTISSCKTVVLFINKSDVLSGTPSEVERTASEHYKKLVADLEQYKDKVDIRVLVGSATSGHSTHHLFSHFVDRILPKNAYDAQLLQRMMAEPAAEPEGR